MNTKVIKLSAPIELHGKITSEIVLKEPTGGQLLEYGDPMIVSQTKDGTRFVIEDKDAIRNYLDHCIVHDNGSDVLRLASMSDVRKVKEALFGFFDDGEVEASA